MDNKLGIACKWGFGYMVARPPYDESSFKFIYAKTAAHAIARGIDSYNIMSLVLFCDNIEQYVMPMLLSLLN